MLPGQLATFISLSLAAVADKSSTVINHNIITVQSTVLLYTGPLVTASMFLLTRVHTFLGRTK